MTTTAERLHDLVDGALGGGLPVRLRAWDGSVAGPVDAPLLDIRSRRALRHIAWSPNEMGVARAYIAGDLDVPGGAEALHSGLASIWTAVAASGGVSRPGPKQLARAAGDALRLGALGLRPRRPEGEIRVRGRRHTVRRDAAVIAHHYDMSNAFYALFMDESMAYSSAYYGSGAASLEEAQTAKLDLICDKLGLEPGMRLLDVGCGWGSLTLHAARTRGVRVVGATISAEQHAWVTARAAELGVADLVDVRVQDYRALDEEPFDAVASIEMGEHVGQENYPTYLGVVARHLAPGARALVQQMSRRADAAPGGGPFIEAYIAPDMHMRPIGRTLDLFADAGFEVLGVQGMRTDYVRTVADWTERYEKRFDEAVALVGEERARMWRLYLVGGGLAFEQGRMGVDQILATRAVGA